MNPFNITTTATLRPELLQKTFESFTDNLFKENIKKAHLILNIDFAGIKEYEEVTNKLQSIYKILDSFDFGSYTIRYGNPPHFPTAFMWVMNQIKYPLFFNLEEDWELLYEVDFPKMVNLFDKYPDLAHLRLSFFPSEKETLKNWNRFLDWNGEFFEVSCNLKGTIGFAGHPSLNSSNFMKQCLPHMNPLSNPEKQIKHTNPAIKQIINEYRFGSFQEQSKSRSINDIGRSWMVNNNFRKKGNKAFFTNWQRSE